MQRSSEQPLVGEEHCVTTLITAAKETNGSDDEKKERRGDGKDSHRSHPLPWCRLTIEV